MKKLKFISIAILFMTILLIQSCADSKKLEDGKTYRPYGLLNQENCKNDSVQYTISGWAVASGVIFFECIIPPIYTFGFNLYEPVCLKKNFKTQNKGIK